MAQEVKPVIYFDEHQKGVILNKTNAQGVAKVYGDDEDDWLGKRVVLVTVPSRTPAGEATTAIRMKPAPEKKKAASEMEAALDDDDSVLADTKTGGGPARAPAH